MNEMVRFITGPAPIDIADLYFFFYSSSFRGISQNATTAMLTNTLNASIQSCGHLIEPPNGVIPPGSGVIFVTSTSMCAQANPFVSLSDTLYIIYQNSGNSQGHFRNNGLYMQDTTSTPGPTLLRWLRINVSNSSCGDTVVYDANQLINIHGNYGGMPEVNDGATVNFTWPGEAVPSYVNYGCQAPFQPTVVTVTAPGGVVSCGDPLVLNGAAVGDYTTVLWHGGEGVFSNTETLSTTYTPSDIEEGAVELSFSVLDSCQDTITGQITIVVSRLPQVILSGDTALCHDQETTILTVSGADNYVWSNGASSTDVAVSVMDGPNFWVSGSNACGSDTAHVTLTSMQALLTASDISCSGMQDGMVSVVVDGGVPPYVYAWSTGESDAGLIGLGPGYYSVVITDGGGCQHNLGTTLEEPPPIPLDVSGDTIICSGTSITLMAAVPGDTGGYTYSWSPTGPVVTPTGNTMYEVFAVHSGTGCASETAMITVNIHAEPVADINYSELVGCAPHCISFEATADEPVAFHWALGTGGTESGTNIEHCFSESGTYTVSLTIVQDNGCPDLLESIGPFTIGAMPVADFMWEPSEPTIDQPIQFIDLSTNAESWAWDFGGSGNNTSVNPSPAFTFMELGCHPVALRVLSAENCSDSMMVEICFNESEIELIPNVFTPNDDGFNDVFHISGRDGDMQIFNRWGQLVAHVQNMNQGWDGRSSAGAMLNEGTYFYVFRAIGQNGRPYTIQGSVMLLR